MLYLQHVGDLQFKCVRRLTWENTVSVWFCIAGCLISVWDLYVFFPAIWIRNMNLINNGCSPIVLLCVPVLQHWPLVCSKWTASYPVTIAHGFLHWPKFVSALEKLLVDGLCFYVGIQRVAPVPQCHSWVRSTAACNWEPAFYWTAALRFSTSHRWTRKIYFAQDCANSFNSLKIIRRCFQTVTTCNWSDKTAIGFS